MAAGKAGNKLRSHLAQFDVSLRVEQPKCEPD